jgi:hypothetical protein
MASVIGGIGHLFFTSDQWASGIVRRPLLKGEIAFEDTTPAGEPIDYKKVYVLVGDGELPGSTYTRLRLGVTLAEFDTYKGTIQGVIDGAVAAEASARQGEDNTLRQSISGEETARKSKDSALQQSISDEETARKSADSSHNTSPSAHSTLFAAKANLASPNFTGSP